MASEGSFCFRKNIFLRNIIKESSERKGGKQKQKKKPRVVYVVVASVCSLQRATKKKQLSDDSDRIMLLIYTLGSPKPPVEIVYKESLSLSFS